MIIKILTFIKTFFKKGIICVLQKMKKICDKVQDFLVLFIVFQYYLQF